MFCMPYNELLQGFNAICVEILTCAFYFICSMPLLFAKDYDSKIVGNYCIRLITVSVFVNIGFAGIITLRKVTEFIRKKCFRKNQSAKCMPQENVTTSAIKVDSI